jgi:hypothetical protein
MFAVTLFLSSGLLFLVQPMVGKMILPYLGGVPAVWNTCMVFFQAMLLLGYGYSHFVTTRLSPSAQFRLHLAVMSLPLLVLPIAVSPAMVATAPSSDFPVVWLLGLLFVTAGLPFFVVSTMSPMLQRWFSLTDDPAAKDPYFLYAASNAGSMLGLLAYPFILEPMATVLEQSRLWQALYVVLIVLTAGCWLAIFRRTRVTQAVTVGDEAAKLSEDGSASVLEASPPTTRRRLEWVLLAFIPSSLMLGLTTYISTDIASGPLLWVLPLALYLLTFILVFARRPILLPSWMGRGMCLVAMFVTVAFLAGANHPMLLLVPMHVLLYFTASMVAHGKLAGLRPAPKYLTEYFLWMSIGGVLGGVFNALIAPLVFTRVVEYVIVIALACAVREVGAWEKKPDEPMRDLWMPLIPGAVMALSLFVPSLLPLEFSRFMVLATFGPAAVLTYSFVERPRRFALSLLMVIAVGSFYHSAHQLPLFLERNFFSTVAVADDLDGRFRNLMDGNTIHGRERLGTTDCEPLSYYHRRGPMGALFDVHGERTQASTSARVALVGVGIGSLACYGRAHEHWDLFEINPAVVKVAEDPALFTILKKAPVGSYQFIVGDARQRLAQTDASYDVIVVDAFSSGSIPVHLLTLEAVELYVRRLNDGGMLAFNISNRLLNLEPVVANVAAASGLVGYALDAQVIFEEDALEGQDPSLWIVMARETGDLGRLIDDPRARRLEPSGARPWSDAFSNIATTLNLSW